jgi:hypothetical protein
MKATPFLIQEDALGRRLEALQANDRLFDECWLQKMLMKQPEILPTAEIESVFHPLVAIGREVTVRTGSIDNLFISHGGYLVLVETKLWRNPEAKREVVAQAIDYGSSISKWTYTELDEVVRKHTKEYADQAYGLIDWVEHKWGPVEGGQEFFEETVAKNLRLGRFLTLIVGDRIRPSVIEMMSYVNKYPHLAIDLALIQLTCYRWKLASDWPLLIVPNLVKRTETIARSIIQVTVKLDGTHQIDVQQEGGTEGIKPPRPTEEAFWELLKAKASESYELSRKLIESYRGKDGINLKPTTSLTYLYVMLDVQGTGEQIQLFYLSKDGLLCAWPEVIGNQLVKAGVSRDVVSTYETKLRRLIKQPKQNVAFGRLISQEYLEEFTAAVDAFISDVQAAERQE